MSEKSNLRKKYKALRREIHCKDYDNAVCKNLLTSELYKNAEKVLLYAGLDDEICIDSVIIDALKKGKKTALPVCSDDKGNMDFYYINSLNDLKLGFFSVREPDKAKCEKCSDFSHALCIVPGISFDKKGYRLGYGKGYYDRFLKKFTLISVGLCYNELICDNLPTDRFDVPVNFILTQDKAISV